MKILVFGNIGSGKSTVAKLLADKLNWPIISIDDYRRKYSNGTKRGESKAKYNFCNDIQQGGNQVIEYLGVGKFSKRVSNIFHENQELVLGVLLIVPIDICRARIKTRSWNIPFPKQLSEVDALIERTELRISKGEIEKMWSKRENTTIIKRINYSYCDINNIAHEVLELVTKIKSRS